MRSAQRKDYLAALGIESWSLRRSGPEPAAKQPMTAAQPANIAVPAAQTAGASGEWEQLRARGRALHLEPLVDAWEAQLAPFFQYGLLLREGPWLRFTPKGMLLSNGVLQIFV